MKEIRESGENYLEVILDIQNELGEVRSVEIARRLHVSRASVSKALGVLRDAGLVEPAYYGEVVLTQAGKDKAAAVRHRHEVITRYLMQHLGLTAEVAEADACRMEHIVSDAMMASIEAQLVQPQPLPIRIIATDMDGTLLDSNHQLPPELPQMLENLKGMGVYFVVASGRQYFNLYNKFGDLADDIYYIAENGAMVAHGQEILQVASFDRDRLCNTIDFLRTIPEAHAVYCGENGAYIEIGADGVNFADHAGLYFDRCHVVEDVKQVQDRLFKIAIYNKGGAEAIILPKMQVLADQMKVILSATDWVDLMPQGVNKGAGLQILCDKLQLQPKNCLAFGDYLNDLELVQMAGFAYVMENAHPDLKKACPNIAPSNNENGVMRTLRRFFGM